MSYSIIIGNIIRVYMERDNPMGEPALLRLYSKGFLVAPLSEPEMDLFSYGEGLVSATMMSVLFAGKDAPTHDEAIYTLAHHLEARYVYGKQGGLSEETIGKLLANVVICKKYKSGKVVEGIFQSRLISPNRLTRKGVYELLSGQRFKGTEGIDCLPLKRFTDTQLAFIYDFQQTERRVTWLIGEAKRQQVSLRPDLDRLLHGRVDDAAGETRTPGEKWLGHYLATGEKIGDFTHLINGGYIDGPNLWNINHQL